MILQVTPKELAVKLKDLFSIKIIPEILKKPITALKKRHRENFEKAHAQWKEEYEQALKNKQEADMKQQQVGRSLTVFLEGAQKETELNKTREREPHFIELAQFYADIITDLINVQRRTQEAKVQPALEITPGSI